MKKIIEGKLYDTEKSEKICDISPRQYRHLGKGDSRWDDTYLYRTKSGRYFIAGEGGPASQWATPVGNNFYTSGSGLRRVSELEARRLAEEYAETERYAAIFGMPEAA